MTFANAVSLQERLLRLSRRPILLFTLYTGLWFIFEVLWHFGSLERREMSMLLSSVPAAGLAAVVAVCWGMMIWRDEGPRARDYHWSLPVNCSAHDAARVVGGAVWLVAGITWYLLLGLALLAIHGVAADALQLVTGFGIVSMYTTGLLAYLFATAISVSVNHPAEWALGVMIVLFFIIASNTFPFVSDIFSTLFSNRYGLVGTVFTRQARDVGGWFMTTTLWMLVATLLFGVSLRRFRRLV